jgi:hypothetical protein
MCSATVDTNRLALNEDIASQYRDPVEGGCGLTDSPPSIPPCQFTADFATAVSNTGSPQQLDTGADAGDHVNLTDTGYSSQAATIPVIAGENSPLAADSPPGA